MNTVRKLLLQIRDEQRAFWRNVPAAVFTVGFTLLFLILFSALEGNTRIENLHNVRFVQYFIPSIITLGLISSCYTSLAMNIVTRRSNGVLKRIRGTPLPTWVYFGGLVGSSLITSLLLSGLTIAFGEVFYSVGLPGHWVLFVLAIVVGAITFSLFGVAVSCLVPNPEAAPAIINLIILPLYFISGTFYPIAAGSTLAHVANVFPVRPFILSVLYAYDPGGVFASGSDWHGVLVLCGWSLGSLVFAMRRFTWMPNANQMRKRGKRASLETIP